MSVRCRVALLAVLSVLSSLLLLAPVPAATAAVSSPVTASPGRGFYTAPIDVALTAPDAGAQIRWTVDGTTPTSAVGTPYTRAIHVTSTTTLRAVAYAAGVDPGPVATMTYVFVNDVVHQPATVAGWPNFNVSAGSDGAVVQHDYEMDPSIVDPDPGRVEAALTAVPTLSITSQFGDIFGPAGWYDTNDIEKRVSVEYIDPTDPSKNTQADVGIEGHSHDRLKRALKLNFRSDYGTGKWSTDLLKGAAVNGASAPTKLDKLVLRSGNNRCWCRTSNPSKTTYTEDQWFRDSQIAMSGYGSHGQFVQLYINGLYWGLYNAVENPDDAFQADYFGGSENDYWSVSHEGAHGAASPARWNYLSTTLVNKDMTDPANYAELQDYVDLDNFADYLALQFYGGVTDWPNNNWWAGNRATPTPGPLRYFEWDGEWSFDVRLGGPSQNGAWVPPSFRPGASDTSVINAIWRAAVQSPEFRLRFADRVNRAVYNNGALTEANAKARFAALNSYVSEAVVAESARWGDSLKSLGQPTRTRDVDWQNEVNAINDVMTGNPARLVTALKTYGYYPSINAPTMSQQGGDIAPGFALTLTNPNAAGSIYYTTDGTDPRAVGGSVAAGATLYSGPLTISTTQKVRARVLSGTTWSAEDAATFTTPNLPTLAVTEVHYNATGGNNYEYVEVTNTGSAPVQLAGVQLTTAVTFTFPAGTLNPGERIVAIKSAPDFVARYGSTPRVAGVYGGNLASEGERVVLVDSFGRTLSDFSYSPSWYPATNAGGYSLVARADARNLNLASSWRASTLVNGSPAAVDPIGVSVDDVSTGEGGAAHTVGVTVRLNDVPTSPVSVGYATADGTATSPADYQSTSGSLTFAAGGALTQAVSVPIVGDTAHEPDETFAVNLTSPTGGVLTDATATVTVTDDDNATAPPSLTVRDAATSEGDAGEHDALVDVTLSTPATTAVTVDWSSADGTAGAGDYTARSGTVSFPPGQTSAQLAVPVLGDTMWEPDESFTVTLSGATGAALADAGATVTVSNDDPLPTVKVDDVSVTEGDVTAHVPVTVTGTSSASVTVPWSTGTGSAAAGSDYVAASGVLTFAPGGPSTQLIDVAVKGDASDEPDESVPLTLGSVTGATVSDGSAVLTIVDDDAAAPKALFIAGALPLSAADQVVVDRLGGLGFTVSLLDDADTSAAATTGAALVLYSATGSSSFMSRLSGVAVPVVTWEAAGYDDLGMTAAGGNVAAKRALDIVAGDPMSTRLTGRLDVLATADKVAYGSPAAGALIEARVAASTKASVFGYAAGAQMASRVAPARRAALFLSETSATTLTAAGKTLLDKVLLWTAGTPAGPPLPPVNAAPSVDAGPDRSAPLAAGSTSLDATVTDDGLPDGAVTSSWARVSGPGAVSFGDTTAVDTTVSFTAAGTYVLRLTAGDGQLSASDDLTLTVTPPGSPPAAGGAAVFIAGSLPLSAADQVVADRVSALGYTVSLLDDNNTSAAAVSGASLVLFSASGSSTYLAKLATVAVPVITWEAAGYDDLGMTTSGGNVATSRAVDVLAADPMSTGLTGRVDLLASTGTLSYGSAPAGATVQAYVAGSTKAAVFGFSAGAQMATRVAPARRVGVFLSETSATTLTASGIGVLDRAITWAAG